MRLIAKQAFYYGDKNLKVGEAFTAASDEDARILKGVGKAKDAPQVQTIQTRAMVPLYDEMHETRAVEADDEAPRGRSKRYARRDMRAQD